MFELVVLVRAMLLPSSSAIVFPQFRAWGQGVGLSGAFGDGKGERQKRPVLSS